MSYSYSLYLGYPAALISSDLDQRIEQAVGQPRDGSGMGVHEARRDIDFSFPSMRDCHQAAHALFDVMPEGSTLWIWENDLALDDAQLVVEETDFHGFVRELDARQIAHATPPTARRKQHGRL